MVGESGAWVPEIRRIECLLVLLLLLPKAGRGGGGEVSLSSPSKKTPNPFGTLIEYLKAGVTGSEDASFATDGLEEDGDGVD